MELLGNHLQIFVSLGLVLCAAAVALVCELLKRNNEHLRELNVELRVRRDAEIVRNQVLVQAVAAANAAAAATQAVAPSAESHRVTEHAAVTERVAATDAGPSMERAKEFVSRKGRRPAEAQPAAAAPVDSNPGASLAEARMLAREFMGRAAARAGHDVPTPDANPTVAKTPEVIVERPVADRTAATAAQTAHKKNWDKLLGTQRKMHETPAVEVVASPRTAQRPKLGELIPFETLQNSSDTLSIPEGFHEGMTLARLLNGEKPVRGLVIVIGINDFTARRDETGELGIEMLTASVTDHLRTILQPGEFACQKAPDEFLMICPSDHEPAAQHRLGEIAEALWDFQLRAIGTSSILFSWGGVEAKGEPFADVLAAASERMQETRRSRRSLSLEVPQRRRAV